MDVSAIEPKPAVCRQSCVKCAISCERKFFLQYRLGVTLRGVEKKESADIGKLFHKFQELGPGSDQEVLKYVQKIQAKLVKRVEAGEDLDGSLSAQASRLTDYYNKARVMAQVFNAAYPPNPVLVTLGTEIKESSEIDGLPISGTIDKLLVVDTKGATDGPRDVWVRDHKSSSQPLDILFSGAGWNIQPKFYRHLAEKAIRRMIGEGKLSPDNPYRVRGLILDGILKPGIKLCRTDNKNAKEWQCTPEEAYLRRVKEWYEQYEYNNDGAKAILSKPVFFLDDGKDPEFMYYIKYMKNLFARKTVPQNFPRDPSGMACFQWTRKCVYHELCEPGSDWDDLFKFRYKLEEREDVSNVEETQE